MKMFADHMTSPACPWKFLEERHIASNFGKVYNITQLAWHSIQHYVSALNPYAKTRGVLCTPFARLNYRHAGF
jgi:hypothetical protein